MPRNEVEISLSLENRMSREAKRAGNDLEQFQRRAKQVAIGLGVFTGAAALATGAVVKLTQAALEQRQAENTLATAIRNTGAQWGEYEEQIKAAAAAIQAKTNFGDEAQLQALSRMVAITGDAEKAMAALPAVVDAAAISGSSLETVAGTLTRALSGQANTAESLGITFDKTAGFQERLQQVMDRAGGAAEAQRDPFIGLQNAVGDLTQAAGEFIAPAAIRVADRLTEWTLKAIEATDAFRDLTSGIGPEFRAALGQATAGLGTNEEKILALREELQATKEEFADFVEPGTSEKMRRFSDAIALATGDLNAFNNLMQQDIERNKFLNQIQALEAEIRRLGGAFTQTTEAGTGFTEGVADAAKSYQGLSDRLDPANSRMAILERRLREVDEGLREAEAGTSAFSDELTKVVPVIDEITFEMGLQAAAFASMSDKEETALRLLRLHSRENEHAAFILEEVNDNVMTAVEGWKQHGVWLRNNSKDQDDNTATIVKGNRALAERIALQEKLTGKQLLAPGGRVGPSMDAMITAFLNPLSRAINPETGEAFGLAGLRRIQSEEPERFQEILGRGLPDPQGGSFNFDRFRALVVGLHESGEAEGRGVHPLILAIRRLNDLMGFQSGGVVPGPTGSARLAVVHGGEEVLTPQERRGRSQTVVNNFDFRGSFIGNSLEFQRMVSQANRDYKARGGGRG